jgi:hypothetical protein
MIIGEVIWLGITILSWLNENNSALGDLIMV